MVRVFAFMILLLILAGSAFAQPFQTVWAYQPGTDAALTTTCDGATPIPDNWVVKVYWDVDRDGPDLTDPLATVCDVPPDCETGPAGTVNYNQFNMNGIATFGTGGYFFTDFYFSSSGALTDPPRFYLRIFDPVSGNFLWTSSVKTMVSGYQETYLTRADWTCGPGGPQCVVRDEHE